MSESRDLAIRTNFPPYVHSIIASPTEHAWPAMAQAFNECDFAATANALNLLAGEPRYHKDLLVREAGPLFQPALGGTISPTKGWLMRRRGFGTHFGCLARTAAELVLRDLINRSVPVIIELGAAFWIGKRPIYGRHAVVLVGYSAPYTDSSGTPREEYYLLDSQWPALGAFAMHANDADRDGDGVAEPFPGNRTLSRAEFLAAFPTGIYFPVFRSQPAHDAWYHTHIRKDQRFSILGWLDQELLTGSHDQWVG